MITVDRGFMRILNFVALSILNFKWIVIVVKNHDLGQKVRDARTHDDPVDRGMQDRCGQNQKTYILIHRPRLYLYYNNFL